MKTKIIFMGTPEFSVKPLEALYNSKNIDVELVITGQDKKRSRNKIESTPVKKKALELGINCIEPSDVNAEEILNIIDTINPDYIVVIAYGQMIKKYLLENYKDRIINIHSSLLPKYRGAAPMQFAILNKEKETGVCSMLIEKTMDTGDVLDCKKIELTPTTDINYVHDKLSELASDLIVDTLLNYPERFKNRIIQDDSLATYSTKISKQMGHLSFSEKAEDILAKIMAIPTYVEYKGQNVKIHNVSIIEKYNESKEGEIIEVNDEGIFVNAFDKCIKITEIQFPGKKKMSVSDYLKGNTIEFGEVLK